ncbi:unnamed protein product [Kluyveromyces dobzhanskii CBS 2104]|uniref:RNA helicase n=1 Tax=Kluyveromyces dobzhanskii CBS 2104 TaxID=1427455 RepID=A0A0A8L4R9_9SACH|nr:unnamed protein product [Kluyveromyces dobzhanskii CBS 2104]
MVNKVRKNVKPTPKGDRKGRISKNHPKNKPKNNGNKKVVAAAAAAGKSVNADELNWKSVEIPDTLDDFGGFYGLEEIDGVDVKVVNGKVEFITRDDKKIKNPSNNTEENDDIISEENEEDVDMDELIEFKNFDDVKEGELSAASDEESDFHAFSEEEASDEEEVTSEEPIVEGEADKTTAEDPNTDELLQDNVFSSNVEIDDQENPDLPEWSDKLNISFTVLKGLAGLGFTKPTDIQMQAIPQALQGNDIMGKASTGSGKTLAYGIPIIEQLIKDETNDRCIGLIFTPTRELAHQVTDHLQKVWTKMSKMNKYTILSLTGGLSIQKQERVLKYDGSGRIIVATPGRFLELIEKNPNLIPRFSKIDTLVLDEADRLLQDGHFDEFEKILKMLGKDRKIKLNTGGKPTGSGWQTMIFSATFSLDLFTKLDKTSWKGLKANGAENNEMEQVLNHLMTKIQFKSKPVIIDTNPEHKVTSQVKESLIECLPMERDLYVYYFIMMYPGTTLVFCNAIDSVKKLNAFLNNLKISSFQIHSSMAQKNRLNSLEKFKAKSETNSKAGVPTVLIASDVAARGLDISNIKHVLHYHLPRSADVYIHRSGRTARGESEGVSVMICSPQEAMGPLRKLRKVLSTKKSTNPKKTKWQNDVPMLPIEPDIVSQLRERSRIAAELADDEIATKSLHKDDNWLKKAAEELDIELDTEDEEKDQFLARNKTKKLNKQLDRNESKSLKHQLAELLQTPLRKDLRKTYLTGGLTNLADSLIKNKGHNSIIGHEKVDALETLKSKKRK